MQWIDMFVNRYWQMLTQNLSNESVVFVKSRQSTCYTLNFNLPAINLGDDPPHNGNEIQNDLLHLLATLNGSLLKNCDM